LIDLFLENSVFLIFIVFTFILAGSIKGCLGIGLPAAAMSLMTILIDPIEAIAILTIPIIFTNVAQYFRSQKRLETAIELKYFAIFLVVTVFVTSFFIKSYPTNLLTTSIGIAMVLFSLNTLIGFKINLNASIFWQFIFGVISGILGGLSSIWAPPVAMYLIARDFPKERFIGSTGFLFFVGSIPLTAGLFLAGVLSMDIFFKSLIALVASLIGFRIGEMVRSYVSEKIFRKAVLVFFLVMGLRLIIISIY